METLRLPRNPAASPQRLSRTLQYQKSSSSIPSQSLNLERYNSPPFSSHHLSVLVAPSQAAAVGERFVKRRFFSSSSEGSSASFVSCIAVGMLLARTMPGASLLPVLVGAASATLIRFLPAPLNDNLTIPLFSAGVMVLTSLFGS